MVRPMARNSGKDSEAIFEEKVSGVVFRLRDKADLVGLNQGRNVAAFGNPSDYLVACDSGLYFAEVKSTTNKISFSLSSFTSAQKSAITRLHKNGYGRIYKIYVHSLHLDQWFIMDASEFYNTIMTEKRKSKKWTELTPISW